MLAGAVTTALLTFAYRYLSFAEFSNDHFVHLSIAQQITRGALPVRDFVERGIPLMSMLSAGAQIAFGEGLRSELLLIATTFALAAALTYVVAKRISGSTTVASLATLVPVLVYPVSYSYPKLLAPAIVLTAAWLYVTRPSPTRLAIVAIGVAISFLLRHDLGIIAAAGVAGLLMARDGWWRGLAADVAFVAAVVLLCVSPYLAWVQAYQGVGVYFQDGLAFSRREAQRANWWEAPRLGFDRSRPFIGRLGRGPVVNVRWRDDAPDARIVDAEQRHGLLRRDLNSLHSWQYEMTRWSARDVEALVKDPLAADTNGIDRSTFELRVPAPEGLGAIATQLYGPGEGLRLGANGVALFFYLLWLIPIAAVVALAIRWKYESPLVRPIALMTVILQLAMNLTMLRDPLDTRMRDVVVPMAVLLSYLGWIGWWTNAGLVRLAFARTAVLVVIVVALGSAAALGDLPAQLKRTEIAGGIDGIEHRLRTIGRSLAPPDHRTGPPSPVYRPVVEYIGRCASPDARLWMLTFAPELFFYTGRAFAGGHVSLSPGYFTSDRDATLMLDRVSHENVPLVIMDSQTQSEMLKEYPRIGAYVTANYREAARFPVSREKSFVVLARQGTTCSAPA